MNQANRTETNADTSTVTLDLETALLIRRAFVPRNPRRMRNTTEEVRQAALRFIEVVELATRPPRVPPLQGGDGATGIVRDPAGRESSSDSGAAR